MNAVNKTIGTVDNNKQLILFTTLSVALFVPLFIFRSIGPLDFWWWMSGNLIVLLLLIFITDKSYAGNLKNDLRKKVPWKIIFGLLSALILYVIFYFGNIIIRQLFEFAEKGINNVYGFKGSADDVRIVLLMLVVIGPGEELFWRGFIQEKYERRFGYLKGYYLATGLYTLVHVATGNVVLIIAALVCGLFWGWLYMKYRSMLLNIVSHTVWDIVVFIVLPFTV